MAGEPSCHTVVSDLRKTRAGSGFLFCRSVLRRLSKPELLGLGNMLRVIRWVAICLVVILAGVWAGVWWRGQGGGSAPATAGIDVTGSVSVGGPFSLVDPSGKAVTDADFRGRWMLVYFGYTFCPDVCPTELQAMMAGLDVLGKQAAQVAPIFITVDPQRDTPAAMGEYVKLFDDRLIGLTGSQDQVKASMRAYRVYAAKSESKTTSDYLMDHSSFLYLMGPDGKLRSLFKAGTSANEIAQSIRAKMSGT
jgi:protein SCO1/2